MRIVIQRVLEASVSIAGIQTAAIGQGLLVLVGFESSDTSADVGWMCRKVCGMRIFSDANGKMNASVLDVEGELLVVSQFTLHAATRKGNRPSFMQAARPEQAIPLYEKFVEALASSVPVSTGEFGADMQVRLVNDGPVTITVDSKAGE